jgi:hypothetical protein
MLNGTEQNITKNILATVPLMDLAIKMSVSAKYMNEIIVAVSRSPNPAVTIMMI